MSARAAHGAACKERGAGMATCSHGSARGVLASQLGLHEQELLLWRALIAKLPKVSPAQQPHVGLLQGGQKHSWSCSFLLGPFASFRERKTKTNQ